ncbi:hypothetical protein JZX76_04520 [Haloarcula hispanica]|uniref:Uncharacterized protein n=1 Tax=Haloarcula hispanica TaxID=51589 RepID=A0A482T9K6_HALHI|nr:MULTISPECIES: hypothetical protein [Haloarcula]AJF26987.1 hypothetical protein SG26_15225 [Haloarcula sp. CBA1115]KZX48533.1 hypothetical protein AV929_06100 [Haloarcula sp. K1]MCJ0618811.1 hypothetical protein [Haloarcula hispanica]RYJ09365.1 hypothetical protein ELS20_04515 [Haloarcula hispanica]
MAEFTLLELHLDGAEFTANAPFSSTDDDDESERKSRWSRSRTDEQSDETDVEADGGRNVGRFALAVFGAVALVAVVLRLYLGGSDGDDSDEAL